MREKFLSKLYLWRMKFRDFPVADWLSSTINLAHIPNTVLLLESMEYKNLINLLWIWDSMEMSSQIFLTKEHCKEKK